MRIGLATALVLQLLAAPAWAQLPQLPEQTTVDPTFEITVFNPAESDPLEATRRLLIGTLLGSVGVDRFLAQLQYVAASGELTGRLSTGATARARILPVIGTHGQFLSVDSATGYAWIDPPAGGASDGVITGGSLSGSTLTVTRSIGGTVPIDGFRQIEIVDGVALLGYASRLIFDGNLNASLAGESGHVNVSIPHVGIRDEGSVAQADPTFLDCVGAGIACTADGDGARIEVSATGMGGGLAAVSTDQTLTGDGTAGDPLMFAGLSRGNWASGTTYQTGDIVVHNSNYRVSLQDGNVGNTPLVGLGEHWGLLSPGGTYAISTINARPFHTGQIVSTLNEHYLAVPQSGTITIGRDDIPNSPAFVRLDHEPRSNAEIDARVKDWARSGGGLPDMDDLVGGSAPAGILFGSARDQPVALIASSTTGHVLTRTPTAYAFADAPGDGVAQSVVLDVTGDQLTLLVNTSVSSFTSNAVALPTTGGTPPDLTGVFRYLGDAPIAATAYAVGDVRSVPGLTPGRDPAEVLLMAIQAGTYGIGSVVPGQAFIELTPAAWARSYTPSGTIPDARVSNSITRDNELPTAVDVGISGQDLTVSVTLPGRAPLTDTQTLPVGGFTIAGVAAFDTAIEALDEMIVSKNDTGDATTRIDVEAAGRYFGAFFDLHDHVGGTLVIPAGNDRLLLSNEDVAGDPNAWTTVAAVRPTIEDDSTPIETAPQSIDFTGDGIDCTADAVGRVTCDVPLTSGGGGGGGGPPVAFRATLNSLSILASPAWQHVLDYDTVDIVINEGAFTTETITSRERVVIPEDGLYRIVVNLGAVSTTGRTTIQTRLTIQPDGGTEVSQPALSRQYNRGISGAGTDATNLSAGHLSVLHTLTAGDRIGVQTLQVNDASNTYSLQGGGISFIEIVKAVPGGSAEGFVDLTDTPPALGTAGQFVAVDAGGTQLTFVDPPSGGGDFQNIAGNVLPGHRRRTLGRHGRAHVGERPLHVARGRYAADRGRRLAGRKHRRPGRRAPPAGQRDPARLRRRGQHARRGGDRRRRRPDQRRRPDRLHRAGRARHGRQRAGRGVYRRESGPVVLGLVRPHLRRHAVDARS